MDRAGREVPARRDGRAVERGALILALIALVAQQPRVRVEVLNTTKVHGLAHRATRYLRDQGLDVVGEGTIVAPRDTTLVLDNSNHPEWAARVARTLSAS